MLGIAGRLQTSYTYYQGLAGLFIFMMIFSFTIGIWLLSTNGEGGGQRRVGAAPQRCAV